MELIGLYSYHETCVQLLLGLRTDDIRSDDGHHLAAVCTLRSYEILAEDFDPNRHLSGAYAFSSATSLTMETPSLWKAGFFNYLREDITFSLMNRRTLKIDLTEMRVPSTALDDEDQLNIAALYLAEAINMILNLDGSHEMQVALCQRFQQWYKALPDQFNPFFDSSGDDNTSVFPTVRLLRDCHVAVAQYCLVTTSLASQIDRINGHQMAIEKHLHNNAVRLCGMAFSSNSPAVLVNSFGPISYCGRHIQGRPLQADLIRRLHACGKETGWPVGRMIDDLESYWTEANSNTID